MTENDKGKEEINGWRKRENKDRIWKGREGKGREGKSS